MEDVSPILHCKSYDTANKSVVELKERCQGGNVDSFPPLSAILCLLAILSRNSYNNLMIC